MEIVVMKMYRVFSAALLAASAAFAGSGYVSTEKIEPLNAPFEMPQLQRPVFPDAVFRIADFGANAAAHFNNADAINKAIVACSKAGGGHVLIPEGNFNTGPLVLRSNVNLHLENGAVLNFIPDPSLHTEVVLTRYEGTELMNIQPFIYARDCENIAITGLGTINGSGEKEWKKNLHLLGNQPGSGILGRKLNEKPGEPRWKENAQLAESFSTVLPVEKRDVSKSYSVCPSLINPVNCRNVLFEGFKIGDCGPKWTIHPVYCENVIIRRIATTFSGHSNDIAAIDSCKNTLIEYCDFSGGDDLMVVKSGTNEDGWRVNRPTENLIVRHLNGFTHHSAETSMDNAVFSMGTEISGGVKNVYMYDLVVNGRNYPFRIKSRPGRGGIVQGITLEHLSYGEQGVPHTPWISKEELRDTGEACDQLIQICNAYKPLRKEFDWDKPTIYRDITIRDVRANNVRRGFYIHAQRPGDFQNIVVEDLVIDECEHPLTIQGDPMIELKTIAVAGKAITLADNDTSFIDKKTKAKK
jgi:polygalacturonase